MSYKDRNSYDSIDYTSYPKSIGIRTCMPIFTTIRNYDL